MTISIRSVSAELGSERRTNDFWSSETVQRWKEKAVPFLPSSVDKLGAQSTPGVLRSLQGINTVEGDPFLGGRSRPVLPSGKKTSEMEAAAVQEALRIAGIEPHDVGVLLTHSMVPDYLTVNHASIVQDRVGLAGDTFCLAVDAVCTSFMMQLKLAKGLLADSKKPYAVLCQSSTVSRMMRLSEPGSSWFGDAATAEVVHLKDDGLTVVDSVFFSDGSLHEGLLCGVPGKEWYEEGQVIAYSPNPKLAQRTILYFLDYAKQAADALLSRHGVVPAQIRFFASHQPAGWFVEACRDFLRLSNATYISTFPDVGSLGSSNVPYQLSLAMKDKLIQKGDFVFAFTGASGVTYGATLLQMR